MKAHHCLPKFAIILTPLLLWSNVLLYPSQRGNEVDEVELRRKHDPVPQIMISNFFNILIQGAQAITAENSEDQINATANVLNSIANLAQLAMRSAHTRLTDEQCKAIHDLSAKLYRACINNEEFMHTLEQNREAVHAQLIELFKAQEQPAKDVII